MDALPAPGELIALCSAIGLAIGALVGLLIADADQRLRDEIIAGATIGGIVGTILGLAIIAGGALAGVT